VLSLSALPRVAHPPERSISRRLTIAAYNKRLATLDLLKELGETSAGIR
jgi:hypothetical protein